MSNTAQAIVFDAPLQLSIKTLEVKAFEANDIEVDVTFSGISTGTERLLWTDHAAVSGSGLSAGARL